MTAIPRQITWDAMHNIMIIDQSLQNNLPNIALLFHQNIYSLFCDLPQGLCDSIGVEAE